MLPSSRNFLLQLRDLASKDKFDKLETFLVKSYGQEGHWRERLQPLLTQLNIKSGILENRTTFIQQFVKTDDIEQAILFTKELLKQKAIKQIHLLHFNLGILYTKNNQLTKAIFAYESSLRISPGFSPSVLNYTSLLKKQNRGDEALYYLERWLKYYKTNYKIQCQFLLLAKQHNIQQVMKMFKGKKLHPFVQHNLSVYLKKFGANNSIENGQPLKGFDNSTIKQEYNTSNYETKQKHQESLNRGQSIDFQSQINSQKLKQLLQKKRSLNHFYLPSQFQPDTQHEFKQNKSTSKNPYNNTFSSNFINNFRIKQDKVKSSLSRAKRERTIKLQPTSSTLPMNATSPYNDHTKLHKKPNIQKLDIKNITQRKQQIRSVLKELPTKRNLNNLLKQSNESSELKTIKQIKLKVVQTETQKQPERNDSDKSGILLSTKITKDTDIKKQLLPPLQQQSLQPISPIISKIPILSFHNDQPEKKSQQKHQQIRIIEQAEERAQNKQVVEQVIIRPSIQTNQENSSKQQHKQINKPEQLKTEQKILEQSNISSRQMMTKQSITVEINKEVLLDPQKYKINPLKKKVSYNQKLVQVKYERKSQKLEHSLNKSLNSMTQPVGILRPDSSKDSGLQNSFQPSDQNSIIREEKIEKEEKEQKEQNAEKVQQKQQKQQIQQKQQKQEVVKQIEDRQIHQKQQNNPKIKPSRNNSSVTASLKKSILMLRSPKISSILPQQSITSKLEQIKIKQKDLEYDSFHLSKRSINQSSAFGSNQDHVITKSRKSMKDKQINQVIQEVIKIRQSVDLGGLDVHPYSDDQITQVIEKLKQQYKNSQNHNDKISLLLKIGELFEKDNNIEAAVRTYEKCIKSESPQAFLRLGQLQLNRGEIALAIQNLQKAYHSYRKDVRLKLKLAYGYSLFSQGLQKAISITNSLLLDDPTNLQAILLSSNIYQKQGQIDTALDIITAVDHELINQSIKHYMGLLYLQDSNIQQAYECFRDALKINNKYVPSMIECATILSTNKPLDAIKIFKRVLKSQPKNQTALGRLAKIYETQQQYPLAIELYTILITMVESYGIYESIGFCQTKTCQYQEAIIHFKKAITFESNIFCWKKIAECYEIMKHFDKALNYYEIALKMEPSAYVYRKIGLCMIYLENFKGAIRNLKLSLTIEQTLEAYSTIANCHYLVSQFDQAITYYEKALAIKGYDTNVYYNMAICYDQKEQFIRSKPLYQKILNEQPNNIKCLFNLANILLIMGKPNNALELFEKALKNDMGNRKRRIEIIELYEILNNLDKAQEHLIYCFEQDGDDLCIIEGLLRISRKKKDIKKVNHYTKLLQDMKAKHQFFVPQRSSIEKIGV